VSIQQAESEVEDEAPVPSARAAELARLSPSRAALELAWPGIIEQSLSALGTAAVFAFVGQLGATATAGVGAAGNFRFLMFPVWRSLAIGTVAVVSRRMGEGRPAEAADATRQSLLLGAIAGVAFGAFFVLFALTGIVLAVPVVSEFARSRQVPRFPTAILAASLELLAGIVLTAGVILDSLARKHREVKRLHYLQHAAPCDLQPLARRIDTDAAGIGRR